MISVEILFLGLALAIDAAVVSFAIGLLHLDSSKSEKIKNALLVSLVFGSFQFLMLWLGSYGGLKFSFSSYGYLFQVVVIGIFFLIASKFVQESLKTETRRLEWGFFPVLLLAFVTSLDALVSGISIGTLPQTEVIAFQVGLLTWIVCLLFYVFSQFFQQIPEKWLLRFAAIIFLILGGSTLIGILQRG